MKKMIRKPLALSKTTVRTLARELADAQGGISDSCLITHACYTKPAGGCP